MRGNNTCICKLEKSLNEIIPLLNRDYSKYIDDLLPYNIADDDKPLPKEIRILVLYYF
ncbi:MULTISPECIES: hypothetical protein [Clostridium]|uniref:hypothetical protein n=1 Tax=Clostridium TaxID=1485 RepID=UPI000AEC6702|nr:MULTISPECIES: hypothetical protein [Clostridium]MCD2346742.1 hypothetical protein [Clostridium guangxiense]